MCRLTDSVIGPLFLGIKVSETGVPSVYVKSFIKLMISYCSLEVGKALKFIYAFYVVSITSHLQLRLSQMISKLIATAVS